MYCTDTETVRARKQHKCTSCGEKIEAGEQYKKWVSFDDGSAYTNKMHPECLAMHDEDSEGGTWEYMPYSHDRPKVTTPNAELNGAR